MPRAKQSTFPERLDRNDGRSELHAGIEPILRCRCVVREHPRLVVMLDHPTQPPMSRRAIDFAATTARRWRHDGC
jgi:hypothetical protein